MGETPTLVEVESNDNLVPPVDEAALPALIHPGQALTEPPRKRILGRYYLTSVPVDETPLTAQLNGSYTLVEAVNLVVPRLDDEAPFSVYESPFVVQFDFGPHLLKLPCVLKSQRDHELAHFVNKASLADVSGPGNEGNRRQPLCKVPGKPVLRRNHDATRTVDVSIFFPHLDNEARSWPFMAAKGGASEKKCREKEKAQRA